MDRNQRKYNGQLEINNLIDDSVNNALDRRNQAVNTTDGLSTLSDDEVGSIVGGLTKVKNDKDIIAVAGFKPICPPITVGLIAVDPSITSIDQPIKSIS